MLADIVPEKSLVVKEVCMLKNSKIRNAAKLSGIRLWQVAEALGMQDSAFSRKLRHELQEDEQQKIISIIERLAKEDHK